MYLNTKELEPITDSNSDQEPVQYEVEVKTQPFVDTIPCPPPDWNELESEIE